RAIAGQGRGLPGESPAARYGVTVRLARGLRRALIEEVGADRLDAVLCAVVAAWGYRMRRHRRWPYGVPPGFERDGWIADPELLDQWDEGERS
ncbi:MAG: hypothetical protein O7D96_12865, partial [SAR324 cluster bacterium]|nr:hypothetical protein [SAR324 cluster bacterium]